MAQTDYVLGTADEELQRLGFQAQVWQPRAVNLWRRAGFRWGHRLLDLGCGPGFATVDLARVAGPEGHVLGVDVSEKYLQFLASRPVQPLHAPISVLQSDVQQLQLEPNSLDGAFERWCLCFVPRPELALRALAQALKPGGRLAMFEYADYTAMRLTPQGPHLERLIQCVAQTFRDFGGEPNLARYLPAMLEEAGLVLESMEPCVLVAEPGSELWQWPETFFKLYGRSLVQQGKFPAEAQAEFEQEWEQASVNRHARFYTPLLMEIVARKP